jgi:aminoglycoside phosphotransferase (APT) family kinase protein
MLPSQEPREIVCHGDYAPYNVAAAEHEAVGIIDFDAAHPAPRLWDLAYAVYRWAPLSDPSNPGVISGLDEQLRRAEIFCMAYGMTAEERHQLPETICRRLQALVNFMQTRASAEDGTFMEDVAAGHARLYLSDIDYISTHRDQLLRALR